MIAVARSAQKAPLCKGSWLAKGETEGLLLHQRIRRKFSITVILYRTIPPSRLTAAHLPLHKGGFGGFAAPIYPTLEVFHADSYKTRK